MIDHDTLRAISIILLVGWLVWAQFRIVCLEARVRGHSEARFRAMTECLRLASLLNRHGIDPHEEHHDRH